MKVNRLIKLFVSMSCQFSIVHLCSFSFCREDHKWLITTHIYTHSERLVRIVNYSQQPLRIRQIRVGEITIARAR